jgi:hypothetical protein
MRYSNVIPGRVEDTNPESRRGQFEIPGSALQAAPE